MRNPIATAIILLIAFYPLTPSPAYGQKNTLEAAREHYARGLELIEEESFEEAIVEFKRAYQISPHYSVLYNLGMAYVVQNQPVEAVDALSRYLRDGGSRVPKKRVADVEREISRQKARIAFLVVKTQPEGAAIRIDAEDRGKSPHQRPIEIGVGSHVIEVSLDEYQTVERRVSIASKEIKTVEIALKPLPAITEGQMLGQLDVRCPVPDVRIVVDGGEVKRTPLSKPLLLTLGDHEIAFQREGYRTHQRRITVVSGPMKPVKCGVKPLSPLPVAIQAKLDVEASEPGASIKVDGAPLPDDGYLPNGKHRLEVRRAGFDTWEKELTLKAKEPQKVEVQLVPKPDYLSDYQSNADTVRTLAYVIGSAGIAVTGVTVGLVLWNAGRYDDWNTEYVAIDESYLRQELPYTELDRQKSKNDELLNSILTVDKVTIGTGIAGGALLITGVVLFFVGNDPNKYQTFETIPSGDGGKIGFKTVW